MRLLIVGAGGHAKVVADAAIRAGMDVVGAVGESGGVRHLLGVPVHVSPNDIVADAFIVGIGDNRARMQAFGRYIEAGMVPVSVVHSSAVIATGVTIGAGCFIAAGAIVNPDAAIGENTILNTGCTVDHDCAVGSHCLVGPGAGLCGTVTIGEGVLLGAGACVTPGVRIGAWSVIGAGAAVIADVPAEATYGGVPAHRIGGAS